MIEKLIPEKIWKNEGFQKIFCNIFWLSSDKIFRMGIGIFVGILVARYLGPENYGTLNFVLAFTGLFAAFVTLGLDNIVIKELVHSRFDTGVLLGTTFFLKLLGSLLATILSFVVFLIVNPGENQLLLFVLIIASGFIFQSFDTIDFWFQSQILSKYPVLARNFSFIISSGIKIGLISLGAPLVYFIIVTTLELILSALFLLIVYKKQGNRIKNWKFDYDISRRLIRDSFPLFLSALAIGIYMKIDLVLVRQILNDYEAGIYAVATNISGLWYFIPTGIAITLFPVIIKSKTTDEGLYYRRMQALFDLMAILSIIISLAVTLLAPYVINLLYGSAYSPAVIVLMIYAWGAVPIFLACASSNFIIAENLNRVLFFIAVINVVVNITLNYWLIPIFGPSGAAAAMLITQFSGLLIIGFIKPLRRQFILLINSLNPVRLLNFRKMVESLHNIL